MYNNNENMFQSCRKPSKSTVMYSKVTTEGDEGHVEDKASSLEHIPLGRLRSLKGNNEVYIVYMEVLMGCVYSQLFFRTA